MDGLAIKKLSVVALKYAPMVASLVMCLHVGLLLVGIDTETADYTFSLPLFPWLVCMLWSKAFGFCTMHRHCITYVMAITYCIKYQEDYGFGGMLTMARLIAFVLGIAIIVTFLLVSKRCNCVINQQQ